MCRLFVGVHLAANVYLNKLKDVIKTHAIKFNVNNRDIAELLTKITCI